MLVAALGLYWKGRLEGAAIERPKTEAAQSAAAVATLETRGARATAAQIDVLVRTRDGAEKTVDTLTPAALKSEDAHVPLAPDRTARLQRADRELCQLAPDLGGCSSAN